MSVLLETTSEPLTINVGRGPETVRQVLTSYKLENYEDVEELQHSLQGANVLMQMTVNGHMVVMLQRFKPVKLALK